MKKKEAKPVKKRELKIAKKSKKISYTEQDLEREIEDLV